MFLTSLIFSLICISSYTFAENDLFHNIMCNQAQPAPGKFPLDIGIKGSYATTIRYTNWDTKQTALIKEKNFTDVTYAQKIDRTQTQNFIIGNDSTIVYNETSCVNSPKTVYVPILYPLDTLIVTNIVKDNYFIGDIINSIMNINFNDAKKVNNTVIGGVDAIAFVGCNYNVTNTTGIQVVVFYSAELAGGQQPYSGAYKNPVPLSVHFSTFDGKDGNYTVKSHTSLDISGLQPVLEAEREKFTVPPRGMYCENMNPIPLPGSIPERFSASIDFVNTKTQQIDNIEIMYDNILKVTHYALDFENDLDIPFISGLNVSKDLTRASIYRDFNYGIQYVTSKDGRICKDIKPLDLSFGDSTVVDGKVHLVSSENILLNVSNAKFYKYGNFYIEGVEVQSYITKSDEKDGHKVVEVNFIPDTWTVEGVKGHLLHSIVHYHKDNDMKLIYETYIHFDSFQNFTKLGPLWLKNNAFPCSDSVEDNFFYINLQNVSLKNIQSYGTENVECALAETLSQAVNVSVFRISYFMFKENEKAAIACFLLGKKSDVKRTPTAYLKDELTVTQFKEALNKTVLTTGLVTKLITEDQKSAAININRLGVINTQEPTPVPQFVGYSSGSMFILAVFSFIFGAAISVGTYVFYTKKRTISGMTYQVFE